MTTHIDRSGSQIDHLNVAVPDLAELLAFYQPTLAAIGITKILEVPADFETSQLEMHGFGWANTKPFFWLLDGGQVGTNMHVAFTVYDRNTVHAFHQAAVCAGGTSIHEPGIWEQYHPDYYGAFVFDPNGTNVEAVCHLPQ